MTTIVQCKWWTFAAIPLISAFATSAHAENHLCGAQTGSAEAEKTLPVPENEPDENEYGSSDWNEATRRLRDAQRRLHHNMHAGVYPFGMPDCTVEKPEEKAASTISASDYPTGIHETKAPFPTEEFWRKVRSLLSANNGEITPADVEKVFGFKLEYGEFEDGSGHNYDLKSENAWYRYIGISSSKEEMRTFVIELSKCPFVYQHPTYCLNKNYINEDLKKSNWKFVGEDSTYGQHFIRHRNGEFILVIKLNQCCAERISLVKPR